MSDSIPARPDIEGLAPYIEVFDMPVSLRFYRDVLGFELTGSSGEGDDVDWVMLELGNSQFMMNTAYEKTHRPAKPDPARQQAHRDITFYFNCPDIDGLYNYLSDRKVEVVRPPHITVYGWKAVSVKDPDGYGICFHAPPAR
jgi:glyoxylase I family protein